METLPNLICGKFTVGGKDNLPPDSLGSVEKQEHDLTDITQENYKEIIFGTIEDLAKKI